MKAKTIAFIKLLPAFPINPSQLSKQIQRTFLEKAHPIPDIKENEVFISLNQHKEFKKKKKLKKNIPNKIISIHKAM